MGVERIPLEPGECSQGALLLSRVLLNAIGLREIELEMYAFL